MPKPSCEGDRLKNTKHNDLLLLLLWFLLPSSCSAAQTSAAPSSPLRPVILTGTHWQATYLAFETAKKTFPGDKCEKDDEEGVIRIHRDSFFTATR